MADDHAMDEPEVHLGFLEEPRNAAEITSPYFPSKAGGMPVCPTKPVFCGCPADCCARILDILI